jgi:hypothetical protein
MFKSQLDKIDKNLAVISFIIALAMFWYVKKQSGMEEKHFTPGDVYLKRQGGIHDED